MNLRKTVFGRQNSEYHPGDSSGRTEPVDSSGHRRRQSSHADEGPKRHCCHGEGWMSVGMMRRRLAETDTSAGCRYVEKEASYCCATVVR